MHLYNIDIDIDININIHGSFFPGDWDPGPRVDGWTGGQTGGWSGERAGGRLGRRADACSKTCAMLGFRGGSTNRASPMD